MYKGSSILTQKRGIQKSPGSLLISVNLLFSLVYVGMYVCTCVFVGVCIMCISLSMCVCCVYMYVIYVFSKRPEFYESRHCGVEI